MTHSIYSITKSSTMVMLKHLLSPGPMVNVSSIPMKSLPSVSGQQEVVSALVYSVESRTYHKLDNIWCNWLF